MIGFSLAILTALFTSIQDIFKKKALQNIDNYVFSWGISLFGLLLIIPIVLYLGIPKIGTNFYYSLCISGIINTITTVLYVKALQESDLSIIGPLVTFTPLFLLITSPIIVNEYPSYYSILGVILVVLGSYILNIKDIKKGILKPFKSILIGSGAQKMLIVAFLWSISSNFDKIGVLNSSPFFWILSVNLIISIILTPLVYLKSRDKISQITNNYKTFAIVSIIHLIAISFQMLAISFLAVIYVIAIKRLSAAFNVFFGYIIFKEKNIFERFIAVLIMLLGVMFITLVK